MASGEETHWRDFAPSLWSKRFGTREEVLDHHLRHITTESRNARDRIRNLRDVPYGDGEREKLDIFGTDLPEDAPILAFVHGGFWHELSREESAYFAGSMRASGVKTVVVGYELCPRASLELIARQTERAVRRVFRYAAERAVRAVYLVGHSAGAHLLAKLLGDEALFDSVPNVDSLQGVFLVSGIYDLAGLVDTPENDFLELTPERARAMSPQFDSHRHLRPRRFRLHVLVAEHDSPAFVAQSRNFYDKMLECLEVQNVRFEIKRNLDHFDIMEVLTEDENYLKTLLLDDLRRSTGRGGPSSDSPEGAHC